MTIDTAFHGDCTAAEEMKRMLLRVDEIHRAVTRAMGRMEYLKLAAERANSSLTPIRYGRGVERSRVEYAVLERDAERWGINELRQELEKLLTIVEPLVRRLPAGLMRAVATQRILEGVPCGLIAQRMHFTRAYVYRYLNKSYDTLCILYAGEIRKQEEGSNVHAL